MRVRRTNQRNKRQRRKTFVPMSSDPGPRFAEQEPPSSNNSSLATENSDDEPLEGEPMDHVEKMLAGVLHPDERTQHQGDEEDVESEDDLDAIYGALNRQDDDDEAAAADSDAEDNEEELALKLHIYTLQEGIREFDAWSRDCFADVDAAGSQSPSSSAANGALSIAAARGTQSPTAAVARQLQSQLNEMRNLHKQLQLLVLNQQVRTRISNASPSTHSPPAFRFRLEGRAIESHSRRRSARTTRSTSCG